MGQTMTRPLPPRIPLLVGTFVLLFVFAGLEVTWAVGSVVHGSWSPAVVSEPIGRAVALVPVALIPADRTERAVLAIVLLLAGAPIVVQGQYYGYHAAALCVVAAVAVFRMLRGGRRRSETGLTSSESHSLPLPVASIPSAHNDHQVLGAAHRDSELCREPGVH
jgi:hypothetical protein